MSGGWNQCARRGVVAALAVVALIAAGSVPAAAQPVIDATTAEFTASADHSATSSTGVPLLTSYVLQIYPVGTVTPTHLVDIGKPTPGTDDLIRFEFASRLTAPLVAGTTYQARVAATGPGGTALSDLSNTFATSTPCAPTLAASSASVPAAASTGSVTVTAGSSCAWTAVSNSSWLTVTSGGSGSGSRVVGFSATANASTTGRSGTLTIAGQTFTVNQSGATPCTYTINPTSKSVVAAGEATSVTVTSQSGCAWTAVSGSGWIVVTSGASGSANGTVSMNVTANTGTSQRTGTVTIAGRTFTVTQAGACAYTVTPGSLSVPATGATNTFAIGTTASCTWTVTGMPSWITIAGGTRTGPGNLSYTIASNPGAARSATLTIAGRSVVVNQGAPTAPAPPANLRIVGGDDE